MSLPKALFIGPMKSGTTWVYDYFSDRGDIAMPRQVKETFFFDRHFKRGLDWYEQQFPQITSGYSSCVEVAPSLLAYPDAPKRVAETLPGVKLIVTTRDPIARSWSHYLHMRRYGYTKSGLRQAVQQYPQIVSASRYDQHIQAWRDANPKSELHVLNFEDLKSDPEAYARSVCEILEIEYQPLSENRRSASNEASVAPSFHLARLGRRLSYALRDAGFYGTVEFAKSLGLKKLFFGRASKAKQNASVDELEFLEECLRG